MTWINADTDPHGAAHQMAAAEARNLTDTQLDTAIREVETSLNRTRRAYSAAQGRHQALIQARHERKGNGDQ